MFTSRLSDFSCIIEQSEMYIAQFDSFIRKEIDINL